MKRFAVAGILLVMAASPVLADEARPGIAVPAPAAGPVLPCQRDPNVQVRIAGLDADEIRCRDFMLSQQIASLSAQVAGAQARETLLREDLRVAQKEHQETIGKNAEATQELQKKIDWYVAYAKGADQQIEATRAAPLPLGSTPR
jgi:hypothetical protein